MPSIKRCTAIVGGVPTFVDVDVGSGAAGPAGVGVPIGGTAGQALTKIDSANYNTQWTTITATVADGSVTNVKLATMPTLTMKGNATGATAAPTDLTAASVKTLLALTKSDVGLANVDNTSDANKPVSTAQAAADALSPLKTTTVTGTGALGGGGDLSANRTITLNTDGVTNTYLANMAANSIKGNNTGAAADPIDLTVAQTKTLLALDQVTNTSDANKPVSTAQATADGLRVLKAGDVMSGALTWPAGAGIVGDAVYGDLSVSAATSGGSISFKTGGTTRMAVESTRITTSLPFEVGADPVNPLQVVTKQYGEANYATLRQTIAASSAATSYTIALADENKLLEFTAATAIAISVPTNATLALPVGYRTDFLQTGAGKITVAAVTPGTTTIVATPSAVLRAPGSMASLTKLAADRWILAGDLT